MKFWTCHYDLETREITRNEETCESARAADYGYATYNEDGFEGVYAESLVSQADADRLVLELCIKMKGYFEEGVTLLKRQMPKGR